METRCLPRPIAPRPVVRKGFVLTIVAALLLAFIAQDAAAQFSGSGGRIILWDGTDVANITAGGRVEVTCDNCGGSGGTSSSFGSAFPASGTAAGFSDGTNMQSARVFDGDTGGGTQYVLGANLVRRASGGTAELIGQATMANSVPTVLASDQSAIPVTATNLDIHDLASATDSVTAVMATASTANNDGSQVSVTTTSGTLLASFSTRKYAGFCASPLNTDIVHFKLGATATTSDYKLHAGQCWNTPPVVYTGVIDARSASGTQEVSVIEY